MSPSPKMGPSVESCLAALSHLLFFNSILKGDKPFKFVKLKINAFLPVIFPSLPVNESICLKYFFCIFLPRSSFHFVQAKREAKRAGDAREAEAQRRTRASKQKNMHIHPGRGRGGEDIGQVPCPLR